MVYMWALYAREVKRFQKIWMDTVFSPIVSMGLYLAVFGIVLHGRQIGDFSYLAFIYTGLLSMVLVNGSFSNPGFSLIIAKNVGTIVDLQVAPISTWQIGVAYALAALTRGLITLLIAGGFTIWFIPGMHIVHPILFIIALLLNGFVFGLLGVAFGMWAKGFESLTFMTTFILQPMIFLAGVFYPVSDLPAPWNFISLFNPIHHTVNLVRYSLLGYQDVSYLVSLSVNIALAVVLFASMQFITKKGLRRG